MISVDEAFDRIKKQCAPLGAEQLELRKALGYVLAQDVVSPIDMPPFNQAAMDGYALCLHDKLRYKLLGESKAGDSTKLKLSPGQAARIFTGALVPEGANAVIKQEIVERLDQVIEVQENPTNGENIRPQGEQIQQGNLALKAGSKLTPGTIGYLTGLGIHHVYVYTKPKISVLASGNELVKPGEDLPLGKIYESNTFMLEAALQEAGFSCKIGTIIDSLILTEARIADELKQNDVVVITGGISVGDYDFVEQALSNLEVKTGFYKVKQKPGKPLFFGYKEKKLIFALPGNPAAVLSCFYLYVLPTLHCLSGRAAFSHPTQTAKLKNSYAKTANLTHFLKGRQANGEVEILGAQSSAMLSAFTEANCLIRLDEGQTTWEKGAEVSIVLLPE